MSELSLQHLVKIYPFVKVGGTVFGRKRMKELLERQRSQPFTTNEGVLAVRDFSLEVEQGEFIVLLGPSGCGKSTILRMIAGLESVSDGDIQVDGKSVVDLLPEQRNIAMIFQNYSLYPNYTVYENMAFPLKNQHIPREQIDQMVLETAKLLELDQLLQRYPRDLSGGQRQRIAIGRALVRKPKLFLMDEPFSNLDPVLRGKLRTELKRIHSKMGTTFIYVTHDQMEAFALGDRIVVMEHGQIRQVGTPQELFNHPANLYTASLVGTPPMNLFRDVALKQGSGGWTVTLFDNKYLLPPAKAAGLTEADQGRKVTLGIRPVHITLGDQGIEATVEHSDVVEAEMHIQLRVGQQELLAIVPATNFGTFLRGRKVHFQLSPQRFHLFDPETEERIGL